MKRYRIKVTEIHSDYVWIDAESRDEAMQKSHGVSDCMYESWQDAEIIEEYEIDDAAAQKGINKQL